MTVISAMKFNPRDGAIVSDEQSTTGYFRKYELATKIHVLTVPEGGIYGLMGGSGAAGVLYETFQAVQEFLPQYQKEIKSKRDLASLVGRCMTSVKRKYVNGYLESSFGLTESDFICGYRTVQDGSKVPIHELLTRRYFQVVSGSPEERVSEILNNAFLMLTTDADGIELYLSTMGLSNATPVSRPYETIGSGADMADGELSSFLESLPRAERENIDPIRGIGALLWATNRASTKNIGVGGTPFVYIIKDGKLSGSPEENTTRLAMEIVRGFQRGLLPRSFEEEALKALIYNDGDFEAVEQEMWKQAKSSSELSLLLRNYKV